MDHKVTGYKAHPFDPADLARGIKWVLMKSSDQYQSMKSYCREAAVTRFDSKVIAAQYNDLYQNMLSLNTVN